MTNSVFEPLTTASENQVISTNWVSTDTQKSVLNIWKTPKAKPKQKHFFKNMLIARAMRSRGKYKY